MLMYGIGDPCSTYAFMARKDELHGSVCVCGNTRGVGMTAAILFIAYAFALIYKVYGKLTIYHQQ